MRRHHLPVIVSSLCVGAIRPIINDRPISIEPRLYTPQFGIMTPSVVLQLIGVFLTLCGDPVN